MGKEEMHSNSAEVNLDSVGTAAAVRLAYSLPAPLNAVHEAAEFVFSEMIHLLKVLLILFLSLPRIFLSCKSVGQTGQCQLAFLLLKRRLSQRKRNPRARARRTTWGAARRSLRARRRSRRLPREAGSSSTARRCAARSRAGVLVDVCFTRGW